MEHTRFSFHDNPLPFSTQFEDVFSRLLKREELDFYDLGVSLMFEVIATNLLAQTPGREWHWYDGVVGLEARIRKPRQIEFTGEIWVMSLEKGNDPGKENFRATVTDKRLTKQNIWIALCIGDDRAEAELSEAFGQTAK